MLLENFKGQKRACGIMSDSRKLDSIHGNAFFGVLQNKKKTVVYFLPDLGIVHWTSGKCEKSKRVILHITNLLQLKNQT